MQKFKVTITTEPMLGMSPNNEKIYSDYIASKSELSTGHVRIGLTKESF